MKLKDLFDIYQFRYIEMRQKFSSIDENDLADRKRSRYLWNMAFAGLGAGTLMLRLGAIVQVAWYIQENLGKNPDPVFNKMLVNRLRDKPVSDGDWKDIWSMAARMADDGCPEVIKNLAQIKSDVLSGFVSARNSIVHVTGSGLSLEQWNKVFGHIDNMAANTVIFDEGVLTGRGKDTILSTGGVDIVVSPLISRSADETPLIFQGIQEAEMKLLDGTTGSEEILSLETVADYFSQIEKKASDRFVEDFKDLISRYTELFVGREDETENLHALLVNGERIIRVTSPAGMGKSAFMAYACSSCKKTCKEKKTASETLVHFCRPGISSNPVSVLQNLLYQDTNLWQGMSEDIKIDKKTSLSSDFSILRERFHQLCSAWSEEQKKKKEKGKDKYLFIFIDGLDESSKVYRDPSIDQLFLVEEKDEDGEVTEKAWDIPEYIAFVAGYRAGNRYRLPEDSPEIQLNALSYNAIEQVPWPAPLVPETGKRLREKGRPFGAAGSSLIDPAFLRLYYDMVTQGSASTENPASVPEGLTGLYDRELAAFGYSMEMRILSALGIVATALEPLPVELVDRAYRRLTGKADESVIKEIIELRPGWFTIDQDNNLSLYHDRIRAWVLTRLSNRDIKGIHGIFAGVLDEIIRNAENKETS